MARETRTIIEIEGGIVREMLVQVNRKVKAEDFIKQLKANSEVETPLLPMGTIYLYQYGVTSLVVLQEYSRIREINARTPTSSRRTSFKIHVPNMQWYVVCLNDAGKQRVLNAYFSASPVPIKPGENMVFSLPLTNYFTDGRGFCLGSIRKELLDLTNVRDFIEDLWASEWNTEVLPRYPAWDMGDMDDSPSEDEYGFGLWAEMTEDDIPALEKRILSCPALITSRVETPTFQDCLDTIKARIKERSAE